VQDTALYKSSSSDEVGLCSYNTWLSVPRICLSFLVFFSDGRGDKKLFQEKTKSKLEQNRGWNRNWNRFYLVKSRTYTILFQRSKQNQNNVGYEKKFRSLRSLTEHHFSFY